MKVRKHVLLTTTLVISLLAVLAILIVLIGDRLVEKKETYVAVTEEGKFEPLVGLSDPYSTTNAVLKWVSIASVAAYTYGFADYDDRLTEISKFFTNEGWNDYTQALDQANVYSEISAKKMNVTAVVTDAPIVLIEGTLLGSYVWRVKVPLLVTYQSISEKKQQRVVLSLLIKKVPTSEMAQGIGIAQIQVAGITPVT